jgi:hypothetical protein
MSSSRASVVELLGALLPSLMAVHASFSERVGFSTPSRALAAFALTLSLVALDVEESSAAVDWDLCGV